MTDECPCCGATIRADSPARSVPQLRRYFAMIAAVFHHWPETHPRQFEDSEALRYWLQAKAGPAWRTVTARIPVTGMNRTRALMLCEAALAAGGSRAIPVEHGRDIVIVVPKSIKFSRMRHLDFCALNDAVSDVIRAETGMDPETVLNEHERAA